ncbi:MAG: M50 family peptidase [Proteobacteria bacterium]|nr:M50 family peptidase [Pseudomonadota bacterium]
MIHVPYTADAAQHHLTFWTMVSVALLFGRIPYISAPFRWLEVFFHEISHGLMAAITGGRLIVIKLMFRGSGACVSSGGMRLFVLLAGYSGAVCWGSAIYLMGKLTGNHQTAQDIMFILLVFLLITIVLWVRDIATFIIMIFMALIFWIPNRYPAVPGLEYLLQFIGIFITLSAIRAPLELIDGKHEGDGAELADLTFIPEGVWILLWFGLGLAALAYMWQLPLPPRERWLTFLPLLS